VPRISFFYGIAIFMYWSEGAHARPLQRPGCLGRLRWRADRRVIASSCGRRLNT